MPDFSHWAPADFIGLVTAVFSGLSMILAQLARIQATKAASQSAANNEKLTTVHNETLAKVAEVHEKVNGRVEELAQLKAERLVSSAQNAPDPNGKAP